MSTSRLWRLSGLLGFFLASTAHAVDPLPEPGLPDLGVQLGPELRQPALDLEPGVASALRDRDWSRAARELAARPPESLLGNDKSTWAFLLVWSLVRSDRAAETAPYLDLLEAAEGVPRAYLQLTRGEALRGLGRDLEALEVLETVGEASSAWGRAAVHRAGILHELGRTKEAAEVYRSVVERPDPAEGNPEALLGLGLHHGAGSPEAYPYLRRLWWAYPEHEAEVRGRRLLEAYEGPSARATWQEVGRRAEQVMERGAYQEALSLTAARLGEVTGSDEDACRFLYTRGRSFYKLNQLSNSLTAFEALSSPCEGDAAAEYGARIQYLAGMARYRKSEYRPAATAFLAIPEHYPGTTFADDGLTQAGIALQEAEDLEGAQAIWRRALEEFPAGDTAPEATWRVAFSLYLSGKPEEARRMAKALGELPLHLDAVHVAAGRYWSARWALYPDATDPNRAVDAPEARSEAITGWRALCEELPHSYYALLAFGRLREEAPEVAQELSRRPPDHEVGDVSAPWIVREAFWEHPGVVDGVGLARVGLLAEGLAELRAVGTDRFTGAEMAYVTELRARSGDWLFAHDAMRRWLRDHPPGTLGAQEPAILRVAYPDRYWDEVQAAAKGDAFDPRLLHALVREESNFNREIRSHAGALGLSQLMPATAREVARWLGKSITLEDLKDPSTNLEIGARYLDSLHTQQDGSPFLSLAAYNAGSGRVKQWIDRFGNVPTDEYCERIPFKETREYVKRVLGTWQTMRWQLDADSTPFPDLSTFNRKARPNLE